MLLEALSLIDVEQLEVTMPSVGLETVERLCDLINRRLTHAASFTQPVEVGVLEPLVPGMVACHVDAGPWKATFSLGSVRSAMRACPCLTAISRFPQPPPIIVGLMRR